MEEKVLLTARGLEQLKERLNFLKTVKRPEASEKIGEARSFGDLSENAEYDIAKDEQGRIEAEIFEIENKIKNAQLIDTKKINTNCVNVGCNITVLDTELNSEILYKIVGDTESDPVNGFISNLSPVGKGLMGKKVGEIVEIHTPVGVRQLKILKIKA